MSKRQEAPQPRAGNSPPRKKGKSDKREKKWGKKDNKRNRRKAKREWQNTPRENQQLMDFYSKMGVIPEKDWDLFKETLVADLPTTFRICAVGTFHDLIQKRSKEFQNMEKEEVDGVTLEPPVPLPWYPDDGAWFINASRGTLRKFPSYKKFHEFLVAFTETGGISRQEAVSMIPPLLLDVDHHHVILDMCAAPGSKTTQMVEMMHQKAPKGKLPTGVIIANDIDEKRCYMMIHQVNRISSPCVIATQHMAQKFPFVRLNATSTDSDHPDLIFDRILADVPCSGDGTFRKNYDLWGKWNGGMGNGLHKVQVQIATRGIKLLKVGGRMVYSTCSMNPAEDEAVVAEILRRGKGTVSLVDVSKELPALKRENGIHSWPINWKEEYYSTWDSLPEDKKEFASKSLFPPTEEEAKEFHLERCLRILPHLQNTGGFFVAVLQKNDSFPLYFGEDDEEQKETSKTTDEKVDAPVVPAPEVSKPRKVVHHSKEDPFLFLEGERWEEGIKNIKEFYGLNNEFPEKCLMIRSEGTCPRIYLLSESAQQILSFEENQCLRIVNMGLKIFGKHSFKDAFCPYRINSEGLKSLSPFMSSKRRVDITVDDFKILLKQEHPFFSTFSNTAQSQLQAMEIGGVWYYLDLTSEGISEPALLSGWRGKISTHLLSSKTEKNLLKYLFLEEEEQPKKESESDKSTVTVEPVDEN